MKIHPTTEELTTSVPSEKTLDSGTNIALNVRVDQGTHIAKSNNGMNDEAIKDYVKSHIAATNEYRKSLVLHIRKCGKRNWMSKVFPSKPPTPPSPIPSYIEARARELGLFNHDYTSTTNTN